MEPLAPPKKQLSSAQKASLARAREKARQSKLAKSQAKADQEKEFVKFQAVTKQASPAKDQSDTEMSDTKSEPSPSPVKHKKGKKIKRFAKKKRKVETSDSETSKDDPANAGARTANQAANQAALARLREQHGSYQRRSRVQIAISVLTRMIRFVKIKVFPLVRPFLPIP